MAHFKEYSEPFVFDFKKLLKALSGKEAEAQSEVDAFMENCAKRWRALTNWGWFRGTPFRSPLQGGLKGLGARGGGDEGLKVEGGFTFGRLQGGLKGASRGLQGGLKRCSTSPSEGFKVWACVKHVPRQSIA